MAFGNPINNLTIPSGAVAGQTRIVIGPDLPPPLDTYLFYNTHPAVAAILYYSDAAGNNTYQFTAIVPIGSSHYLIQGFVTNGVVIQIANNVNFPAGITYEHNSPGNVNLDMNANRYNLTNTGGFNIGDATSGLLEFAVSSNGVFAAGPGVFAEDPNNIGFKENWHTLGLVNGWTGTFKYRKIAGVANSVQIRYVGTPGTKADGTTIATLPVGYRPSTTAQDVSLSCNAVSGGQSPHVNIATTGVITCWGVGGTASNAQIMGTIEQDW